MHLLVRGNVANFQHKTFPCAIGRHGVTAHKIEGDGKTPAGAFPITRVYYRADRIEPFDCNHPLIPIHPNDGWGDDPTDFSGYNKPVTHPYLFSAEHLWREDNLYDICAVLGYNDNPAIAGKGSAIFLHLMPPSQKTAGCVALAHEDLLYVLTTATHVTIEVE